MACVLLNFLFSLSRSLLRSACSLSGFIIVKDFIPISLYVSLEMVQFWQAIFISWDKKMTIVRDGEEIPASAQSSKLNEQLAQVEYVFSDKTGTLTCNSMVFRKCIIDGETYGTGTTEAGRLRRRKLEQSERRHKLREQRKADGFNAREIAEAEEKEAEDDADESLVASADQAEFAAPEAAEEEVRLPHVEFNQPQRILEALQGLPTLSQRLLGGSSSSSSSSAAKASRAEMIQIFMYALALNNSVFPQPARREEEEEEEKKEDANGQRKPSAALSPGAAKAQRKRLERQLSMSSGSGGVVRVDLAVEEAEERARAEADHSMDPGDEVVLESSSPDERALVDFAQAMGYELIRRSAGRVELRSRKVDVQQLLAQSKETRQDHPTASPQPPSAPHTLDPSSYVIEPFEELCMLDFTSKRKRMTVLLRLLNPDGSPSSKVLVLIKGADSALKPYLTKSSSAQWDETYNRLGEMGSESLRTLLLGYAIQDYSWWNSQLKNEYYEAQRHQGASEKGHVEGECSSECRLCAAENAIEASAGFQILGASALEDLLSPQVPETLEKMLLAGIKVWMLTGDQLTTAQNIAISCNLLDAEMSNEGRLFTFDRNLDTPEAIEAALGKCTRRMQKLMAKHQAEGFGSLPVFGLCVHGDVFKTLQEEHAHHRKLQKEAAAGGAASPAPSANSASALSAASQGSLLHRFFDLASKCRSVIACRLEPKEKADIVRLMKKRTGAVTMAVGDGNNDTPMIRWSVFSPADTGNTNNSEKEQRTRARSSSLYRLLLFSCLCAVLTSEWAFAVSREPLQSQARTTALPSSDSCSDCSSSTAASTIVESAPSSSTSSVRPHTTPGACEPRCFQREAAAISHSLLLFAIFCHCVFPSLLLQTNRASSCGLCFCSACTPSILAVTCIWTGRCSCTTWLTRPSRFWCSLCSIEIWRWTRWRSFRTSTRSLAVPCCSTRPSSLAGCFSLSCKGASASSFLSWHSTW